MNMICNEVFDEFSFPSNEEVIDYATRIGIDAKCEPHLLFLAREGLMKPLPDHWKPCFDLNTQTYYYHNTESGKSQWTHPLDEHYQKLVCEERQKRARSNHEPTVIESIKDSKNENGKMAVITTLTEDEDQSTSFQLAADGAKFLKKSSSNSNLRSILRPNIDEHVDDGKKIVRFDLTMTNFVASSEPFEYSAEEDEDGDEDYVDNGRAGPVNDDEDDVEEEIDEIMEKNKQKSFKNSFEILNAKLLDLSEARNRLSVSPVSFDDSESSNKLKMRGRFSISPVSLNDDKDDCLKSKTEEVPKIIVNGERVGCSGSSKVNEYAENKFKIKVDEIDDKYERKFAEIQMQKELEFQQRINSFESQLDHEFRSKCDEIKKKLEEKYSSDNIEDCELGSTITKYEEIIKTLCEQMESLEQKYSNLKEKYQKLKTKVRNSIENRRAKKLLITPNDNVATINATKTSNGLTSGTEVGSVSCSSVENLRKQLKRLDDLEEQLPSIGYDDEGYKVRYPFKNMKHQQSDFGNEIGFFRHRIHLERDCIRRAKVSLKAQQHLFQQQQKQFPTKNNRKEQMNLEISLYRTRGLLGEKIIRLRHLEKSYANLLKNKSKDDSDESTLSDVSSCNSASSGFSSIELNQNDNNLASSSQSHSQSRSSSHRNIVTAMPSEVMRTLEKLNREIHEIWDILISQQAPSQNSSKNPLRFWFKPKS